MSITLRIQHLTRYLYDQPAYLGPHLIRLSPAPHMRQRVLHHRLDVLPQPVTLHRHQDPFGNWITRALFGQPTTDLTLSVALDVVVEPFNPFDFVIEGYAERWPFSYADDLRSDLATFLVREPVSARMASFLASLPSARRPLVDVLVETNRLIADTIAYQERHEPGVQTPEETLALGIGSCRDSTWLLIQTLRALGIAARFASGYLVEFGSGEDADDSVELHAWAEAYVPGAGWVGMDPTSGLLTTEGHIPLAATAHYRTAAPVSGTASLPTSDFIVGMSVDRVAAGV